MTVTRPRRSLTTAVFVLLLAAVCAAGGFWAGRVTLRPAQSTAQEAPELLVTAVSEQTVGRTLTLTTTMERSIQPLAVNELVGVVTQVGDLAAVTSGSLLYTVGAQQARAVLGTVPFFRDMGADAKGEDVKQLQEFLASTGADLVPDGSWGPATTRAVKQWQKDTGQEQTGVIAAGTLVAIPFSPVTLSPDRSLLWHGAKLSGGEKLLQTATGTPDFFMEITQGQAGLVPTGTPVVVHTDTGDFEGVTGQHQVSEQGIKVPVSSPTGGLLCGEKCAELGTDQKVYLLTSIELVPPRTGPAVPVSALLTQPTGEVNVVAEDGTHIPVRVEAVAEGVAVVDGIEVGTRVRVFAPSPNLAPAGVQAPSAPGQETDETSPPASPADGAPTTGEGN